MVRPKTKDRVQISVLVDRDVVETLRAEQLGHISNIINEMARLASGHGKLACPECGCEFTVPAGRQAFNQKQIKNPLGD